LAPVYIRPHFFSAAFPGFVVHEIRHCANYCVELHRGVNAERDIGRISSMNIDTVDHLQRLLRSIRSKLQAHVRRVGFG
jgi:hypothetical protein